MPFSLYRWSSREDANHLIAFDEDNVEQFPIFRHTNYRFSLLALNYASINDTNEGIEERFARGLK